ncbi:hypothetical protein GUITHDRAFT_68590 [Guillardia theta CCMP2712]|uniref:HpcH/HpaI aldolase/citrate lyase domain-containing protein n=1 Tax=Guillardia theta (strain CCMP2712) TaxID=905079 RepID=L1JKG8_GUITC|nr:hypothetical protein GUITHDRAFT_68590 [Guillardia theta CCMP2712]EKX48639.1 hypothetical protein GUITHDRAFT_68590 [Guillardia theta CCMP2712]|eukprot:XP_005835619.1 hypothetical protein GUITHDRAFT_68590 [Guillardia theta CCMP2712]
MSFRPRRSVLFLPGSNTRAINKARTLPADVVIMDLEDAVAPDVKVDARMNVVKEIDSGGFGHREVAIRCNGLDTVWGKDDIRAIAKSKANAVVIPKVEDRNVVIEAQKIISQEMRKDLPIWCMIESPMGGLSAARESKENPLQAVVMGTSDLTKDLHALHVPSRFPLQTSLQMVLLSARAHGLVALDGVHLDIENKEEFLQHCTAAKQMGFDGKTLIHPTQIGPANEVFSPSADDVKLAQEIIAAYNEAVSSLPAQLPPSSDGLASSSKRRATLPLCEGSSSSEFDTRLPQP